MLFYIFLGDAQREDGAGGSGKGKVGDMRSEEEERSKPAA